MKINMPVTNTEVMFGDAEFMLTKTDLKGIITFTNDSFIKTCGYSESELIGQSHNIVRHPDMPVEAFEDLWRDLKAGKPWTGIVKNRTKNGDYYWVEASAAPIFENGKITGYLSARGKPTRQQVEAASNAYRLFKENKAKGLKIVHGKVVKDNVLYKLKKIALSFNVAQRLYALIGLATIVATALTVYGINGLGTSNQAIENLFINAMRPAEALSKIEVRMTENRAYVRTALSEVTLDPSGKGLVMNPEAAAKAAEQIEGNISSMAYLWKSYKQAKASQEEVSLADAFDASRTKTVNEALKPMLASLKAGDHDETFKLAVTLRDLSEAAASDLDELMNYQLDATQEQYDASVERYEKTRLISFVVLGVAIVIIFWLGFIIIRSILKPLEKSVQVFAAITSGNLNSSIDVPSNDELSQVLSSLKSTQVMLNVNTNAERVLARKVKDQSTLYENQLAAISNSTGVIEFSMDGTVIAANDIFLKVLGYSLNEAMGQRHGIFVDANYRNSAEYKAFWEKLNSGESITGEFKYLDKNGKDVWLQASYNPILDITGKPYKCVEYATDITEQKIKNSDYEGQISAIGKSQGVEEISLSGKITKVNQVYLKMLGYAEDDLVGQPASTVLDPAFAKSEEFTTLWSKLVSGGNDSGQYKRITKTGKEVWIQASYNPIFDLNGKPYKIVNYTMDITTQKLEAVDNAGQLAAIDKIQGVVEFDLLGKIISANDNFTKVIGYSEAEIIGNNHSMLVEPAYKSSHEYKDFWDKLTKGEALLGQYKRVGKDGKVIWLQASYNPIMDINGKPFKVVQYATDITEQYENAASLAAAVEETQGIIVNAKEGDLSNRVSLNGKVGAIASLCEGVNALMNQMTEVIEQVRETGETINTAAGEIASGNNDLSSRTEQQASSLEETAASMEELASTVKNNAENAKQANQLAIAASGIAVKGGKVVSEVVTTMSAINSSAKKIEDIISVIDGIAFQTNILALNAAVEAARAGEQGRGFAVVAAEVRNLAQRSATAAKEIKELITDSVSKTAEGTKQVETAGSTMKEIVSSVQRVTDIMGEITAASVEQSAGIDQVNSAVTSMDEVTQQNAALVEEASAAAESLVEQAASLIETVSAFKLSGSNVFSSKSAIRTVATRAPVHVPRVISTNKIAPAKTNSNDSDWEEF